MSCSASLLNAMFLAMCVHLPCSGRPEHGLGEPEAFHYDWAAQLARASPNSRSVALGAMAEDDRLAVQVRRRCVNTAWPTAARA